MTDESVFLVEFVELSLLKEENSVPVILLDLPELFLERSEVAPSRFRNVDCSWIVVGRVDSVAIFLLERKKRREGKGISLVQTRSRLRILKRRLLTSLRSCRKL